MTKRATILVIDDDASELLMLQDAIEEFTGHAVRVAESGSEAIEVFETNRDDIDLLISDVMMPGMKGPELLGRLRASRPALPCIFISGLTEENLRIEGLLPGGTKFLQKPFQLDSLSATISDVLSGPCEHSRSPAEEDSKPIQTLTYQLDGRDQIVFVSDDWLDFALRNDAPDLTRSAVLGRRIWDFVQDASTRHVYELLHREVRSTNRTLTVPFRCDSPDRRRFMELELRALPDAFIHVSSRLLREEARAPVDALDTSLERADEFVEACSFCRRVRHDDLDWIELESLVLEGVLQRPRLPRFTHTVCEDCEEVARSQLRASPGQPDAAA